MSYGNEIRAEFLIMTESILEKKKRKKIQNLPIDGF